MSGTLAFLVFFSLIARIHAIPLALEGVAVFAVSCALLLLTRFEGAITCRTEIDTGTSAAATHSAPDTPRPDHRPPRQRTLKHQSSRRSVWRLLELPQALTQPLRVSPLRSRLPIQLRQAPSQPSRRRLRRLCDLLLRPSHHSVTFPIPARGASIASG
jgi:hypothetical protein